jgi:hypothetical protein
MTDHQRIRLGGSMMNRWLLARLDELVLEVSTVVEVLEAEIIFFGEVDGFGLIVDDCFVEDVALGGNSKKLHAPVSLDFSGNFALAKASMKTSGSHDELPHVIAATPAMAFHAVLLASSSIIELLRMGTHRRASPSCRVFVFPVRLRPH